MSNNPSKVPLDAKDMTLNRTTYKVYRYILRQNRPVGISDVQRGLGLSSPSLSQYHVRKLLRLGLIREEQEGYVIDKSVLENIIMIGRVLIPTQAGFVAFFGAALVVMLVFLRPSVLTSQYLFAIAINLAAIIASLWQARKSLKRL